MPTLLGHSLGSGVGCCWSCRDPPFSDASPTDGRRRSPRHDAGSGPSSASTLGADPGKSCERTTSSPGRRAAIVERAANNWRQRRSQNGRGGLNGSGRRRGRPAATDDSMDGPPAGRGNSRRTIFTRKSDVVELKVAGLPAQLVEPASVLDADASDPAAALGRHKTRVDTVQAVVFNLGRVGGQKNVGRQRASSWKLEREWRGRWGVARSRKSGLTWRSTACLK